MIIASEGGQPSNPAESRDDGSDTVFTDSDYPWDIDNDPPKFKSHTNLGPKQTTTSDNDGPFQDDLLWILDGNFVFIAGDTAFKVHAGTIRRQQGSFLIPHKANPLAEESDHDAIEGCPVVMVEDSAHDFRHLLRIIYDGFDYFVKDRVATFSDLASAARLAHKYDMPSILGESEKRMQLLFPTSSQAWNTNASLRASMLRKDDPIEAINLFRTLQWHNMLPTALYLASQLPIHTLLYGARRADGILETLDFADIEKCVTLHRACIDAYTAAYDFVFPVVQKSYCVGWFRECHTQMAVEGAKVRHKALEGDPLGETLAQEIERIVGNSGGRVCTKCRKEAGRTESSHREGFWYALHSELCE